MTGTKLGHQFFGARIAIAICKFAIKFEGIALRLLRGKILPRERDRGHRVLPEPAGRTSTIHGPDSPDSSMENEIAADAEPFDLGDDDNAPPSLRSLILPSFTVHTSLDSFPRRLRRDERNPRSVRTPRSFAAGDYFQWASRGRSRSGGGVCTEDSRVSVVHGKVL